jgi:DNA-binding transcriptional LysR family regulator
MNPFNGIAVFVRVAEAASFVEAGRSLGISASAVGKSVAKLEASLGIRLFHRTTRSLTLTEEGAVFHRRCRRILDDLREAEEGAKASGGQPRGRLRVGLPTIGYRLLMPVLPAFRARYPEVALDIAFDDRSVDLVEEGFDLVIRGGAPADSTFMSRRLGRYRFLVCAAPAYLAARGTPRTPGDLAGHDLVAYRQGRTERCQPWSFADGTALAPDPPRAVLTCDNMEAVREAAERGLGVAHLPDFLAREGVERGALRVLLPDHPGETRRFTALWPSNRHLSPRVRVFVDHLAEVLGEGG